MNDVRVCVVGRVGGPPERKVHDGTTITTFRLAHNARRFDRGSNRWVDQPTSWFHVSAWRQLGEHVATSITSGQQVVVHGKLSVVEWLGEHGPRVSVRIEAEAVGPDLQWGTTAFTRSAGADRSDAAAQAIAEQMMREMEEEALRGVPAARGLEDDNRNGDEDRGVDRHDTRDGQDDRDEELRNDRDEELRNDRDAGLPEDLDAVADAIAGLSARSLMPGAVEHAAGEAVGEEPGAPGRGVRRLAAARRR